MKDFYRGKKILITGAAGTVGRELVRQLAAMQPAQLCLMDNNESEMFFLMQEYEDALCFLGDVRFRDKLDKLVEGIDIIIHCAAYKHVVLSESNPFDVVQTNILGVENVIRAARSAGVGHVLFTSSDKAVNPTNVMGTSKLMGERLITAANIFGGSRTPKTVYTSTRFGNVIGSRGSVVPVFMKQIKAGGPVTITDKRMTRFIMTIRESATLVLESLLAARGGEVFVTKMPVVKIVDLAEAMIEVLAPRYGHDPASIEMKEIGSKPGEKLYEELMSDEETGRSMELDNMFAVTPAFKSIYSSINYEYPQVISRKIDKSYVSSTEPHMDKETLKKYLVDSKVFEAAEKAIQEG